jgi:hypothetical protein
MLLSFERTVSALADAIARQCQTPGCDAERVEAVCRFLTTAHSKMPDYLRVPFRLATLLFDAWPYPTKGRPFHRLDLSERATQIESWEKSRWEFRRGLIVFYRTLATFSLYSEL